MIPRPASPPRRIYGRRRGRPLRPGQRRLHETLLPQLAVALPEAGPLDPATVFAQRPKAVWLEIGFGAGEHLAAQAEAHPGIGFVGVEVFENGVARLVPRSPAAASANIRIFPDDARMMLDVAGARRRWTGCSSCFPIRGRKRGTTSAVSSRPRHWTGWRSLMRPGAELRLATDDRDYLAWMLEHATAHPEFEWRARGPADWRERPADWPPTRYEEKARAAGRMPVFLRFLRRE